MEKAIKKFLNTLATITSGMVLASLWITESNTWKYALPVCLLSITFSISLDNGRNK